MVNPAFIESPCVNVCAMDPESNLCMGCLRTIEEIMDWRALTPETRSALMKALPERKARLGARALRRIEILTRARGGAL